MYYYHSAQSLLSNFNDNILCICVFSRIPLVWLGISSVRNRPIPGNGGVESRDHGEQK